MKVSGNYLSQSQIGQNTGEHFRRMLKKAIQQGRSELSLGVG